MGHYTSVTCQWSGKENPGGQLNSMQGARSVESARQQDEIGLGQLGAPLEQPHAVMKKYRLERDGRRSFHTAVEYPTVEPTATEKTRTAKAAVRATCFWKANIPL